MAPDGVSVVSASHFPSGEISLAVLKPVSPVANTCVAAPLATSMRQTADFVRSMLERFAMTNLPSGEKATTLHCMLGRASLVNTRTARDLKSMTATLLDAPVFKR